MGCKGALKGNFCMRYRSKLKGNHCKRYKVKLKGNNAWGMWVSYSTSCNFCRVCLSLLLFLVVAGSTADKCFLGEWIGFCAIIVTLHQKEQMFTH